jgi:A/G-specific adenine glycosylase
LTGFEMAESWVRFARSLLAWYDTHRRALPWRTTSPGRFPDPWHILVSEIMLQQTTVATVQPYFRRFIERFPTAASLAAAGEGEVLRLWQGLGYYARARHLQAAAIRIAADFAGQVPRRQDELLALPGVGRYTAGAVGSLAFGQRVPIVDANVARVLCRLDRIASDPRTPATQRRLWDRAREILPRRRVGDFNSALMELGATICRPGKPLCGQCPLKKYCRASADGVQNDIPARRTHADRPRLSRQTYCVRQGNRWLIEQRPVRGRWGGMWQFITIPADDAAGADEAPSTSARPAPATARSLSRLLGLPVAPPRLIGSVDHQLSHRQYHFDVYVCETRGRTGKKAANPPTRRWVTLAELADYPMPRPHVKVTGMMGGAAGAVQGEKVPRP